MGCGSWTTASFVNYATSRGYKTDTRGTITSNYSNQEMFKAKILMQHSILKVLLENVAIMKNIRILYRLFWL